MHEILYWTGTVIRQDLFMGFVWYSLLASIWNRAKQDQAVPAAWDILACRIGATLSLLYLAVFCFEEDGSKLMHKQSKEQTFGPDDLEFLPFIIILIKKE